MAPRLWHGPPALERRGGVTEDGQLGTSHLLLERLQPVDDGDTRLIEAAARSRIGHALFGGGDPIRLGRYHLLREIGAGGFADVHLAYDPQLDRKVALKLLRRTVRDTAAGDLLLREAQALARVTDPGVVGIYDIGTYRETGTSQDRVFIAMEFVEGSSLLEWLRAGERSVSEVIDAFVVAGRGLAAAHAAGLVHLDFKPSNVLRTSDGRIKVCDFGLARLLARPAATEDPHVDVARRAFAVPDSIGAVAGTPRYMAPEQLAGGPTDARTDVYAFAVSLWEALFHEAPFRGDDLEGITRSRLADEIVDPVATNVPAHVVVALRCALHHDRERRQSSMEELLAQLAAPRRTRGRWATALLALVTVGALGVWTLRVDPAQRDRAVHLRDEARDAAARALFVYPLPEDPDGVTAHAKVRELEALGRTGDVPAHELRDEFAETLARLGDRYWDAAGGRSFAIDYYIQALMFRPDHAHALARAAIPPGRLAALELKVETRAFTSADLRAAMPLAALAAPDEAARAEMIASLLTSDDVPRDVRNDLARVAGTVPSEVEEVAPATRDVVPQHAATPVPAAAKLPPDGPPEIIADGQDARDGRAALRAGNWRVAERAFRRALADRPHHPSVLAGLAEAQFEQGEYHEARRAIESAVKLSPRDAEMRLLAGDTAFKVHAYEEARRHYETARRLGSPAAERRLAKLDRALAEP